MATLKPKAGGSPAPPEARITLDELIGGPRPGRDDPARDRVWRDLRSALFRVEYGHSKFDPRHLLALSPAEAARWRQARRDWLRKIFANDPRVIVE